MTDLLSKLIVVHLVIFGCSARAPGIENSTAPVGTVLSYNEDADLTPRQLITKYGYRGESHQVTTEDGYILKMHRITGPNSDRNPAGKQPILLMHGLACSSVDWIIMGPNNAFGYILADEGYDVWLGNCRGNIFSRKHKKYSTLDKEYWQFSWHEVGTYDIPAMIDYILKKTSQQQLIYAGHSQGTTAFWVMASELPEYQNKVKSMFALAPVAFMTNTRSPFYQALARFSSVIGGWMDLLGVYEFEPPSKLLKEAIAIACHDEAATQPICTNIIFLIAGRSERLNETMVSAILGHVPAGAAAKQVVHYAQVGKARKFQQYDHGLIGNLKKYRKPRPPVYDLSKIKVPVHLHYGANDWLSDTKDIDYLHKELGNSIGKFMVPDEKFGHIDFLWANDVKHLLYDRVIEMMKTY